MMIDSLELQRMKKAPYIQGTRRCFSFHYSISHRDKSWIPSEILK